MVTENNIVRSDRRGFVRKLVSVTALGVVTTLLLGQETGRPVAGDTNPSAPVGDIVYRTGASTEGWEDDFYSDAVGSLHVAGDLYTSNSAGTFPGGKVTTGSVNAAKILATSSSGGNVIEGDDTSTYGTAVYGSSAKGYGVQGECNLGYAGVFGKGNGASVAGVEGTGNPGVSAGASSAAAVGLHVQNGAAFPTGNLTEWQSGNGIVDVIDANGQLGIGTSAPARSVHLQGDNAVFRMDRDVNSSAFILTRTALGDFSTIWKTFYVGVDASGVDNGSFFIGDAGTAVSGNSQKRLIIDNGGNIVPPTDVTGNIGTASLRWALVRENSHIR